MAEAAARQKDLEGIPYRTTGAALGFQGSQYQKLGVSVAPFAGRLGGCGCDIKSLTTDGGAPLVPDASPCKSWAEMFEFRAFKNIILWKAALMESMGMVNKSISIHNGADVSAQARLCSCGSPGTQTYHRTWIRSHQHRDGVCLTMQSS